MMTVNEVSKLTGVSIRTLQYYDTIGLLKPIEYTESGYRLYDDTGIVIDVRCAPFLFSAYIVIVLDLDCTVVFTVTVQ